MEIEAEMAVCIAHNTAALAKRRACPGTCICMCVLHMCVWGGYVCNVKVCALVETRGWLRCLPPSRFSALFFETESLTASEAYQLSKLCDQ